MYLCVCICVCVWVCVSVCVWVGVCVGVYIFIHANFELTGTDDKIGALNKCQRDNINSSSRDCMSSSSEISQRNGDMKDVRPTAIPKKKQLSMFINSWKQWLTYPYHLCHTSFKLKLWFSSERRCLIYQGRAESFFYPASLCVFASFSW